MRDRSNRKRPNRHRPPRKVRAVKKELQYWVGQEWERREIQAKYWIEGVPRSIIAAHWCVHVETINNILGLVPPDGFATVHARRFGYPESTLICP